MWKTCIITWNPLSNVDARSNRLLRILHGCSTKVLIELDRNYCGSFYCSYLWTQFNKSTLSKIRVVYNEHLYRKNFACLSS